MGSRPPPLPGHRPDGHPQPPAATPAPTPAPPYPVYGAAPLPSPPPPPLPRATPVVAYAAPGMPKLGRPGGVIAMGVVSIVLGILFTLLNVAGGLALGIVLRNATSPATAADPGIVRPPAGLAPYAGELPRPDGLNAADRATAVRAMHAALPMSHERRVMLLRLLAECGRTALGDPPAPLTADAVKAAVRTAEQLPAGRDGLRDWGTRHFATPAGALLIDDDLARFVPAGGGSPVRVEDEAVVDGAGRRRRSASVVEEELARVHALTAGAANARQAAVLASHLVDHPAAGAARQGGTHARMIGGTLEFSGYLGSRVDTVWVLEDGTLVRNTVGRDPATGRLDAAQRPTGKVVAHPGTAVAIVVATLLEVVLSLLLVICGVAVFADRPAGRRHVRWAWSKIAVAVFGFAVTIRWLGEQELPHGAWPRLLLWLVLGTLLALAYPMILLGVLKSRTASRAYFEGFEGDLRFLPASRRRPAWARLATVLGTGLGRTVVGALAAVAALTAIVQLVLFLASVEDRTFARLGWVVLCAAVAATVRGHSPRRVTPRRGIP
jgi:hypothetical protein